jgi:hypothetical protein
MGVYLCACVRVCVCVCLNVCERVQEIFDFGGPVVFVCGMREVRRRVGLPDAARECRPSACEVVSVCEVVSAWRWRSIFESAMQRQTPRETDSQAIHLAL